MLVKEEIFECYKEKLDELKYLYQDEEIKRTLRVFDLRFKLANDMIIDYSGEISNTKTPDVKKTYVELFTLLEFWNTYEALLHYAKEVIEYNDNQSPYLKLKKVLPNNIENVLIEGEKKLSFLYEKDPEDFDIYFNRIISNASIREGLQKNTIGIQKYLKKEDIDVTGYMFLGLIYAERNMYYHNGEAAKMGMKYKNRLELINLYKEILPNFILSVATFLINYEIGRIV